jgi:hypothetical protein
VTNGAANKYEVSIDAKNPLKLQQPDFKTNKTDAITSALGLPRNASPDEIRNYLAGL